MGEIKKACKILAGKPEEGGNYEDVSADRTMILKCML
jgi:hypothetical protein